MNFFEKLYELDLIHQINEMKKTINDQNETIIYYQYLIKKIANDANEMFDLCSRIYDENDSNDEPEFCKFCKNYSNRGCLNNAECKWQYADEIERNIKK